MTIRFQMTRERTGRRTGPRFRRVVDCEGLSGAKLCAAKMLNLALMYRDQALPAWEHPARRRIALRIARLGMRVQALWARVFAGQIDQHDPRLDAANDERSRLVREYCSESERSAA
jgi:hypothetical protein